MITIKVDTVKVISKWLGAVLLALLLWFKDDVVSTFKTGKDVEFTNKVTPIVQDEFFNTDNIDSLFKHPAVQRNIYQIKEQGKREIIKKDADKVGLRTLFSKEMDIREEKLAREQGKMYRYYLFLIHKMDSIIDYRVDKKIKKLNLRGTHRMNPT